MPEARFDPECCRWSGRRRSVGFSLSHARVEIRMRAAPLDHSRAAGPQAEDWDAGMDVQNVKVAASSGCPEIQVVALAPQVGVQIPAPAELPDICPSFWQMYPHSPLWRT